MEDRTVGITNTSLLSFCDLAREIYVRKGRDCYPFAVLLDRMGGDLRAIDREWLLMRSATSLRKTRAALCR